MKIVIDLYVIMYNYGLRKVQHLIKARSTFTSTFK